MKKILVKLMVLPLLVVVGLSSCSGGKISDNIAAEISMQKKFKYMIRQFEERKYYTDEYILKNNTVKFVNEHNKTIVICNNFYIVEQ